MRKQQLIVSAFIFLTFSSASLAQNTNSSNTSRPRTANTNQSPESDATDASKPAASSPAQQRTAKKPAVNTQFADTGSGAVVAAFTKLREGIQRADVEAVTSVYWRAPGLILFNNNGTVTKGWDQMRQNRESSYPDLKDVKLDVKDVSVVMLGRDGAVLNCLWTQSQTFKGTPETASGRMTLVFKRIGKDWKAVHLHTSPDKEDPSRVLPSERATPTPGTPPPPSE